MSYQKVFQLGRKEMTRFYWHRMLRNRLIRMVLIGLTGGLAFLFYSFETEAGQPGLIFLMGTWVTFAAAVGIHYMVAANQGKNSPVYQQDITINGFGFQVSTSNNRESRIPFEKIHSVYETSTDLFIYANKNDAWILCKDQMDDPAADCALLRDLFRQVIPAKSLHLKG